MSSPYEIAEAGICNQALSRAGSTQSITSLNPSDTSVEADQCRIWYPALRDASLADFQYPWAESYLNLAQVAGPEIDGEVANAQWARSYRYPPDCLKIRRLVATPPTAGAVIPQTTGNVAQYAIGNEPWKRPEGQPYPISYGIGHDDTGRLIETDFWGQGYGLTAVYTAKVEDPTQFSADFADMLAWRLAVDLAFALGFSDSRRQQAERMYQETVRKQRATQFNEMQGDIPWLNRQSEVIRARWGG